VMEYSLGSFGDIRLDRVGASILERMALCKTVCLRRLGGDRGGELRIGRFFRSQKVTADKISAGTVVASCVLAVSLEARR